jgi:hypothetical protein
MIAGSEAKDRAASKVVGGIRLKVIVRRRGVMKSFSYPADQRVVRALILSKSDRSVTGEGSKEQAAK